MVGCFGDPFAEDEMSFLAKAGDDNEENDHDLPPKRLRRWGTNTIESSNKQVNRPAADTSRMLSELLGHAKVDLRVHELNLSKDKVRVVEHARRWKFPALCTMVS
jgi:hypothetical protein